MSWARAATQVRVLEARDRIGGRVWLQRGALRGLDLDMGGAWVADVQRHVWAEADRYGVAREHDALPDHRALALRGRAGGPRAAASTLADLGELERALAALLTAARRHDPSLPPDAQGLEDLDVPAGDWIAALALPRRVEELLLFWVSACASAYPQDASMLEFLRWISAAGHRVWQHLEAAVLGWRMPQGTAALYEAIAADVNGEIVLGAAVTAIAQDADEVTVTTAAGDRHTARRAIVTVPVGVLPAIAFTPPLSAAKRRAGERNHAGQGVKAWVIARDVPTDLFALGHGTLLRLRRRDAALRGRRAAGLLRALGRRARRVRPRGGARRTSRSSHPRPRSSTSTPMTGRATPTAAAPGRSCAPARSTTPGRRCARPRAASTSPAPTPRCTGPRSWTGRSRAATAWPTRSPRRDKSRPPTR